ncbi:MAG: thiamine diphosphokinase [Oscillospiraceae bacterium]|nr:thiamine diphosphokinase [Oscillospiraceae bacterium]
MEVTGICHVVGAVLGEVLPKIAPADLCIAADAGWLALKKHGICPNLVVGDFDSSPPPAGLEAVALNPVKDETDLYAAVRIGKERGYGDFAIYGALGGAWGHSIANFQILAGLARDGCRGKIITDDAIITSLCDGKVTLCAENGRDVSVFAHTDTCNGVTLEGFYYPLKNATLGSDFPLGVSNRLVEEAGKVCVDAGILIVVQEGREM